MTTNDKMPPLPCPLCGCADTVFDSPGAPDDLSFDFVICNGCGLCMCRADCNGDPLEAWNNRTHAAALAERVRVLEARLEYSPRHPYDGIATRDATIRELETALAAARQPVEAEPVAWIESEPSTRGLDIIKVLNSACHTVLWHRNRPTTGNPVWSVYAGLAAQQPATVGRDAVLEEAAAACEARSEREAYGHAKAACALDADAIRALKGQPTPPAGEAR